MLLLWWHDLFLFLSLLSFVSFVLRIKLKSDNGSALKKISGKLESLFIFYQFQWYPLYGEFTVSKPHSSVKSVSIKIFKMSHIQIKHISTLDISIIRSMSVCYIHFSCNDWLFHIFLTNYLHFWHLKYLDWLTGLVMSSSTSIHWSAFSKQQQILSWKSNKGSVPTIYR